jgi:hypothetical protein
VHQQLADLAFAKRELIGVSRKTEKYQILRVDLGLPDMELFSGGLLLYQMMWLTKIPDSDIELLIELLQPA